MNGATSDSGMSADLDIYRTANLLIKEHGEDASTEAAAEADLEEYGHLPVEMHRTEKTLRATCHFHRIWRGGLQAGRFAQNERVGPVGAILWSHRGPLGSCEFQ